MLCEKCGNECAHGTRFCSRCGSPLNCDTNEAVNTTIEQPNSLQQPLPFVATKKNHYVYALIIAAVACIALAIGVGVFITVNRNKPVTEDEICSVIMDYSRLDEYGLKITDYTEQKRDTSKKSGYDDIWVKIVAENDSIAYNGEYFITYGLYNDGWMLNNIQDSSHSYYALTEVTTEQIEKDLRSAYQSTIVEYGLKEFDVSAEIPSPLKEVYSYIIPIEIIAENDEITLSADVTARYEITMNGWHMRTTDLGEYFFESKTVPSAELLAETTDQWTGDFTLSEESSETNVHVYTFTEHDESSYKNCIIDFEKTLTYHFDIEQGGWYLAEELYTITNATLDLTGLWLYEEGREYFKINVIAADIENINYDIDVSVERSEPPYHNCITGSGTDVNRTWSCKFDYDEEERCVVFTTDEPIFTTSQYAGWLVDNYLLTYRAYPNQTNGTSGLYVTKDQSTYKELLTRTEEHDNK